MLVIGSTLLSLSPVKAQIISGHDQLLWLDPTKGVGTTTDQWENVFITAWEDQSGNNKTAWGQLGAPYAPKLELGGINGLPSGRISTGGGSGVLVVDQSFRLPNSFSLFMVVDLASNADQALITTGSTQLLNNQLPGTGWIGDNAVILSLTYNEGVVTYYRNGTLVDTVSVTIENENVQIGGIWEAGALLSELIVYEGVLGMSDLHLVNAYLGERYDIAVIPEPATTALLGGGLLLLASRYIRNR